MSTARDMFIPDRSKGVRPITEMDNVWILEGLNIARDLLAPNRSIPTLTIAGALVSMSEYISQIQTQP